MDKQSTVIVTGATSGIGRAVAIELATRGFHVLLGVRNLLSVKPVIEEISRFGVEAIALELDLRDSKSISSFVEQVQAERLAMVGLINNAGVCRLREDKTSEGDENMLAVNTFGTFLLAQHAVNQGIFYGKGKIINIGTHVLPKCLDRLRIEGKRSFSIRDAYMQSKLAMILLAIGLAKEVSSEQCEITSIFPGIIRSRLGRESAVTRVVGRMFDPFIEPPQKAANCIANLFGSKENQHGKIFNKDKLVSLTYDGDMDGDMVWLQRFMADRALRLAA